MLSLLSELAPRKCSLFGSLLGVLLIQVPQLSLGECLCAVSFTICTEGTSAQLNSSWVLCP